MQQRMVQKARELRLSLDDDAEEDNMAILSSCSAQGAPAPPALASCGGVASVPSAAVSTVGAKGSAKSGAKAKARPKAAAAAKPALIASKMRKETTKVWSQLQTAVPNALEQGRAMMEECLQEHETAEQARSSDQSFAVVELRMKCLALISDVKRVKPSEASCEELLTELNRDAYFREQCWPPSAAQTLGQMTHVRTALIELQRTAEAVQAMAEAHRDAIQLAQTVASSVCAETATWRAQIVALKKARDLEQKELEREQKREERRAAAKAKSEARKAERQEARQKAKQEAAAAAAAAAQKGEADAAAAPGPEPAPGGAKRRPRRSSEVSEKDPALIQCLAGPAWPKDCILDCFDSVNDLADHIVKTSGMLAGVARLRRSATKKVLEVCSLVAAVAAASVSLIEACGLRSSVSSPRQLQESRQIL